MNDKTIITQLKNQLSKNDYAQIEANGLILNVAIKTLTKICKIEISTSLSNLTNLNNAENIVKLINKTQNSFNYEFNEKTKALTLNTNMWIDVKPTYASLNELINEMISSIESIKLAIEMEKQ